MRHEGAYWTVFLEYEQVVDSAAAAEDSTEAQRLFLARNREWRKGKAEELGVPVYVICTNAQATEVVKRTPRTTEALRTISFFGRKKIESLHEELVTLVNDFVGAAP